MTCCVPEITTAIAYPQMNWNAHAFNDGSLTPTEKDMRMLATLQRVSLAQHDWLHVPARHSHLVFAHTPRATISFYDDKYLRFALMRGEGREVTAESGMAEEPASSSTSFE